MNIIKEVEKYGYNISKGLYQLGNYNNYKDLVPLLVDYLRETKNHVEKNSIVIALSKKFAKTREVNEVLLNEFNNSEDFYYKWDIGNAFRYVLMKDFLDEIIDIINNKENGNAREMFILSIGNFKNNLKVNSTLIKLLKNDDLILHTLDAVGRVKLKEAENYVKKYIEDENINIKKEAIKALKKINS